MNSRLSPWLLLLGLLGATAQASRFEPLDGRVLVLAGQRCAPQWQEQQDQSCDGFFSRSNSRLNDNPVLEQLWADYISAPLYLNGGADLYGKLLGAKHD